jgi:ABC-type transport system involved in multi-copper enzyme maturation permease subunit
MSSPLTLLADFPDRLSPMLVKELRQGMRARGFIVLFLAFQGVLAFMLLTVSINSSDNSAGATASGMIFALFGIASLMVQPMRGVNALSGEITGNTIEMMALTRLTASRIVFGKWFAIVSQTALILITIIPYLILRYFLGGMVLVGELVFLTLMFRNHRQAYPGLADCRVHLDVVLSPRFAL